MAVGVAGELEVRLAHGRHPLQDGPADPVRAVVDPVLHRLLVVDDQPALRSARQEDGGQPQDHQVDHAGLERPVRDALDPALAVRHHARQLRVRRERDGRDVPPALDLGHALGRGHVLVVVEGEHHHVAHVVYALQVPRELPEYEVVPREGLGLHALHQADLAVHERRGRIERALFRERVRELFLERAKPGGVYGHGLVFLFACFGESVSPSARSSANFSLCGGHSPVRSAERRAGPSRPDGPFATHGTWSA